MFGRKICRADLHARALFLAFAKRAFEQHSVRSRETGAAGVHAWHAVV